MSEVELVVDARDELGEGPRWNVQEQTLYWVDIEARRYHRLDPVSNQHEVIETGEKIGVLGFRQAGGLIMATERGFAFFDPITGTLEHIKDPEANKPQTQFNDGGVDRKGRFWAGTTGDPFQNSLYRLHPDRIVKVMETGVDVSNGIGWSPDNRIMYYIDSTPALIYAYDFDLETGEIDNRRVFVDHSSGPGVPDGLTVDAEGFVWVAFWDGWCIRRYDPHGKLERSIRLPVQYPTAVAFGGAYLTDLYITSALYEIPREERSDYPLAGGLFRISGIGHGIPEALFAG